MEIEEYEKELERTYTTQGFKKLWGYFLEITKRDYFRNKVKSIREKYKIPKNGFTNKFRVEPLEDWEISQIEKQKFNKEIRAICKKYSLHHLDWGEIIEYYLFYNIIEKPIYHSNSYNLCFVTDLVDEKKEPYSTDLQEDDDLAYPIAIRISPYASQRDIIDYVKRMFPVIERHQKKYRKSEIEIGKAKVKRAEQRDEFIYQNRNKTGKEIKRLVQEKFGDKLPYEYIPKIISREKKRRQKA